MLARAVLAVLLLSPLALAQDAAGRKGELPAELTEAAVRRLGHDRVLLGAEEKQQVFEFYVASPYPVFVTSDSILDAYHVLFEESVLRLEEARTARLSEVLHGLWRRIPDAPDRARMDLPEELVQAAQRRARIAIGTAIVLLGEEPEGATPDVAKVMKQEAVRIDAAKGIGKPDWLGSPDKGFAGIDYTLFRPRGFYYRSLDLRRLFHAVAWLRAIPFRPDRDEELVAFLLLVKSAGKQARSFLAAYSRLLGPGDDPSIVDDPGWWAWPFTRAELAKMRDTYREMRGEMNDLGATSPGQAALRILAPARTPDGVLFDSTVAPLDRSRPDGLEIAAALGSGFARDVLEEKHGEMLLAAIDAARPAFGMEGLYAEYLRCLAALVDAPPERAPEFLRGPAWAAKSCQTVLAGWAQLRHTLELHGKRDMPVLGVTPRRSGFVEPNPGFFTRLAALAGKTRALLDEQGALDPDLGGRWQALESLSARLAEAARKQLVGEEPDASLLEGYGKAIARLMLFGGNATGHPHDDAPRVAIAHSNPRRRRYLAVGVARPRALWVLYPWKGRDVLCRGGVLPYREVETGKPLTDAEWGERLDRKDAPPIPEWLAPYALGR